MALSTADCKQYIANWVKNNPEQIVYDDYSVELKADGHYWICDGTAPKDWTRRTKRKVNNIDYRLFTCSGMLDSNYVFLLAESNGVLTHRYKAIRQFQNHPAVGAWIKEQCGIGLYEPEDPTIQSDI